ncbi:hypothetical protein Pan44_25030 [Caulifigura coniformis]|uniref:Uncharacterized protein n=1 Tax=Caulifigura coniformis TaxID=2527983 RepID=A0A517SEB2_9PLAN|nr:DUF2213 domain-containing protein [Caulifigura coniformis]QDT54470.1 hypothetical protein Pan44_25030 [Caulifigura coniformis]
MSRIQRRTWLGRDYLVAPVVMLTVGVHNGSGGPLFYPPEEMEKSVPLWNGRPIVLRHPDQYPYSATTPEVLSKQWLGSVFNVAFDGRRLTGEAWFDEERVKVLDYPLWVRLNRSEPVEVSTGLYTSNEPVSETLNGSGYTHVARQHRPDHLAILPDQRGACSLAAGCGLLRNSENRELDQFDELSTSFPFLNSMYEPEPDHAQAVA